MGTDPESESESGGELGTDPESEESELETEWGTGAGSESEPKSGTGGQFEVSVVNPVWCWSSRLAPSRGLTSSPGPARRSIPNPGLPRPDAGLRRLVASPVRRSPESGSGTDAQSETFAHPELEYLLFCMWRPRPSTRLSPPQDRQRQEVGL